MEQLLISCLFIRISLIKTPVFHFTEIRRDRGICWEFAVVNVEHQPVRDGCRNNIPAGKGLRIISSQRLHLSGNAAEAEQIIQGGIG